MKKFYFLFLIGTAVSFAQNDLPLSYSEDILQKIKQFSDKSDYEGGAGFIDNLNKNDSLYGSLLTTKTYYLINLEKYDEAVRVAEEGFALKRPDLDFYFYVNKGVALVNLKKFEEAISLYDEGLKYFPKSYLLHYNKGMAYETMGKFKEAIAMYQGAILLNPYYAKPHLQLGKIAYRQQKLAQALICFDTYLMISPEGDSSFSVLKLANDAATKKNENEAVEGLELSPDDKAFDQIDLILNNRVALNEDYKTPGEMDFALIKQSHALLELLKTFKGNGGFWGQRYVPLFKWITDQDKFTDFSYTISYPIQNDAYKKIVEKKVPEIKSFLETFRTKWEEVLSPVEIMFKGQKAAVDYYYEDNLLSAVGNIKNGTPKGPVEFYDSEGKLKVEGFFDDNGKRSSKWGWFHKDGKVKEIANYENGDLAGENIQYFESGKLFYKANYKSGNLDGIYLEYHKDGGLSERKIYADGTLQGKSESFYQAGEDLPNFVLNYVKDTLEGLAIQYFPNGKKQFEVNFDKGTRVGTERNYFANGKISTEHEYKNGELNGLYKSYYTSGKVLEAGQTISGEYDGTFTSYYYPDGTIKITSNYKEGDLDGLYQEFDTKGRLYATHTYSKDNLIGYEFLDSQDKVIAALKKKTGAFRYEGYSAYGTKTAEGEYDVKGGKEGEWRYYNENGALSSVHHYQNNMENGEFLFYHANGQLQSKEIYVNDTLDGVDVSYYKSGKLNDRVWYKKGKATGVYELFYPDGAPMQKYYYHKGELHGEQIDYGVDGKVLSIAYYEYGRILKADYFKPDGTLRETVNYISEKNDYHIVLKHLNGQTYMDYAYRNGVKHGLFRTNYFDGSKWKEGNYINDLLEGAYREYHENGQLYFEGNFTNGQREGLSVYYFDNGRIESKMHHGSDVLNGPYQSFYEDGALESAANFLNNEYHGKRYSYSPDGELQIIRYYDYGRLLGYSYLGQAGDTLAMVPLENETGKITAFFSNGKNSFETEIKHGEYTNNHKIYYASGKIYKEYSNLDGDYHGGYAVYYPDGTIKESSFYQYDELQGKAKKFFTNGKLKEIKTYKNGTLHGVAESYDETGKLTKRDIYVSGIISESQAF